MPEFTTDIKFGPTYQYVCKDCGRRVSRWETTTGGYAYSCNECNETYTNKGLAPYKVHKYRIK